MAREQDTLPTRGSERPAVDRTAPSMVYPGEGWPTAGGETMSYFGPVEHLYG